MPTWCGSPRATTDLLAIDRDREYRNSLAAADAGVGAPVVDYLPGEGVLVVGLIDGETFTDEHLTRPGNLARVAQSCRRLHAGRRFVGDFDMFAIQRRYLAPVSERGFRMPPDYLDFAPHAARIGAALAVNAEGTVPCNNDLLAANFVDDGRQVWIIDYEYGGNNDPCFELGNLASECHLSTDELDELAGEYYGRRLRHKVARCRLYGLMAQYGWTLWASIQDASSAIDYDFWSWGTEKYDTARELFGSPVFETLLGDACRDD